jgi:(1->4)-alpha-D-glucan 1-alpha-D-glucosylmutase
MGKHHATIPSSTYRLQLRGGMSLRGAVDLVPYLDDLGVGALYLSPLQRARPGSTHGYDVVDPNQVDPDVGSEDELRALAAALSARGMGLILDIVPNHMGVHETNSWWLDVLREGRASRYAHFFDIDWDRGNGKLLLPVLGTDLDRAVQNGELRLTRATDGCWLVYYEQRLPVANPPSDLEQVNASPPALLAFIETLPYRPCLWNAPHPHNFRRFFNINDLVGVRVEEPSVFAQTHELVLAWVRERVVTGLRIDHPDGLFDPRGYLERLQREAGADGDEPRPLYVVVEKILNRDELLRQDWPVHGTTGYEQLNLINAVFVDSAAREKLESAYAEFTKSPDRFAAVARRSIRLIVESLLGPELDGLAALLYELSGRLPEGATVEPLAMRTALLEVLACFPVYRTYVPPEAESVEGEDRRLIESAVSEALRHGPDLPPAPYVCIRKLLLLEGPADAPHRDGCRRALAGFQQLTGPALAKGIEDTALYRYVPLASLNEVGGDPHQFGIDLTVFHQKNAERAALWPHALTATSTHDTKRSEGVRCRIGALSEIPELWQNAARRFRALNTRHRRDIDARAAPDANDEYLIYQTLVGVWPAQGIPEEERSDLAARMQEYMLKALREAKRKTRWIEQNDAYESAVLAFVDDILNPNLSSEFLHEFSLFHAPLAQAGMLTSLSQVVLKLGCPGVPDIYQGCELWDFSLVDPDNRRPVDYESRRRYLAELREAPMDIDDLVRSMPDGRLKLWVTAQGLRLRRHEPELFAKGSYVAVGAEGSRARNVVAFGRAHGQRSVLIVTARFFMDFRDEVPRGSAWADSWLDVPSELRRTCYRDKLSGQLVHVQSDGKLALSGIFTKLPVAMLEPAP